MKRFLCKFALFAGLHLGAVAVGLAVYVQRFPPSESFYAASLDKHHLLKTRPSPRMIFVGGSSIALGLDSALVAQSLGFRPINMGLNMQVGLEFMLDEVANSVRSGDMVIVAPEYHAFQEQYRSAPEYVARLVECRPSLLVTLPFSTKKQLLDRGYLQHVGRVLRIVLPLETEDITWDAFVNPYNHRRAFNENGDVIAHHHVKGLRRSPSRFTLASPELAETAINHLNRFGEQCARRGARVFFSHPPYEKKYFELYRVSIARLETMLQAKLTLPMLETAEDMTFDSEEIFDVEYHLNLPGKMRRSELVAASLRKRLGGESRTK
jgi:hypothetical protein